MHRSLGDLPAVTTEPHFLAANPGFAFDYQFINVPDFMGKVGTSCRKSAREDLMGKVEDLILPPLAAFVARSDLF